MSWHHIATFEASAPLRETACQAKSGEDRAIMGPLPFRVPTVRIIRAGADQRTVNASYCR